MPVLNLPKMEPYIHTCGEPLDLNKDDVFEFTVCKGCIKIINLDEIEAHAKEQIIKSHYKKDGE